jgi:Spy/CpxP family protein refolding chaperone
MTKLFTFSALTLAAALAMPATSRAQQATTHHHHGMHALFRGVNMTKDERAQVRTIHQKYEPQLKAARQSGDKATMRTLRTQQLDEMRTVLTPDQQKTFDTNRAALRARAKQGATPPAGTQAPAAPPSSSNPAPSA